MGLIFDSSVLIDLERNLQNEEKIITLDDAGNSGHQYDSLANMWQFNWKTTNLKAGIYHIRITCGLTGQVTVDYKINPVK